MVNYVLPHRGVIIAKKSAKYILNCFQFRLMASQKLTNCGVTVIISLLQRT